MEKSMAFVSMDAQSEYRANSVGVGRFLQPQQCSIYSEGAMNVKQVFPSPWISCDDLGDRKFELVIKAVAMESVHDRTTNQEVSKLVVAFAGAQKRFICNKTQAFAIAKFLNSDDTDGWIGKKIALRAGMAPNRKPTIVVERAAVQAPAAQLDGEAGDDHE